MLFKYSFLAIALLLCGCVYSVTSNSPDLTSHQLIAKLLESLTKSQSSSGMPDSWHIREPRESASQQRLKPIAAPPPSPALGSVEEPVAWPYPPAPKSRGNSEFPLLDRFLNSNGIQSNFQINQINSGSKWNEPQTTERKPSPTPPSIQWNVQKYPEPSQPQPTPASQYIEWGVPQKSQPAPLSSAAAIPPPLNPEENFHIQHNRQSQGQPKRFSIESLRVREPEPEGRDKLNVSFIMPPDIRPLSLNFDTGEVQIDFGDKEGRRVPIPAEALPNKQYRSQLQLDQIFGTQSLSNAKSRDTTQSSRDVKPKANIQTTEDDEYIIVRHDMNKYAYDLPKGMSVAAGPQATAPAASSGGLSSTSSATASAPTQTQQVEKYDISGQKNLHFVLGRVSG